MSYEAGSITGASPQGRSYPSLSNPAQQAFIPPIHTPVLWIGFWRLPLAGCGIQAPAQIRLWCDERIEVGVVAVAGAGIVFAEGGVVRRLPPNCLGAVQRLAKRDTHGFGLVAVLVEDVAVVDDDDLLNDVVSVELSKVCHQVGVV